MQHFKEDSKIGTDVVALNKALPAITCMNTKNGKATWAEDSDVAHMLPKRLVLGGEEDFIVDSQALAETASYLGLHEAVQLPKVYHDFMLGKRWQAGADYIANWLASKSL